MRKSICLGLALWAIGAVSSPVSAQTINDVLSPKKDSIEDLKSEESIKQYALQSMDEQEFAQAMKAWSKLKSLRPNDMYYQLQCAVTLSRLNRHKEALTILDKLKKECAAKREKYAAVDNARLQALFKSGDWPAAKLASKQALLEYPEHTGVYQVVWALNKRWKDKAMAAQLQSTLQHLRKSDEARKGKDSPLQQLLKVFPSTEKCPLPGEALSLVARTECFPSFRLLLARDKFLGDSGVVKYIVRAPNYERVVLFDDESKNFLPLTLEQLLNDHCGHSWFQHSYESVVKVGERKILGFGCDIYKCQFRGESGYHLLALCRDLKVEPGMVRALCHFTYAPEANCVPLSLEEYYLGKKRELISIKSLKLVPVQAAAFELGKGYHQVKDMGELMFSEGGAIKESDLDQFLLSPKNARSEHR
ncbi:MAG: hypothetical protein HY986_22855 [Candidatus Melainabacteria bacterium]|nr:hypothetical protein [Candidatus Melainabacteria bacterium]